jgi:hypothetical protein
MQYAITRVEQMVRRLAGVLRNAKVQPLVHRAIGIGELDIERVNRRAPFDRT